MSTNKPKLIMLIITLSMIIVGIFVWNVFFNKNYSLMDGTDMQNETFTESQNTSNKIIDDKQFEADMKNMLVKKKINKEPITVSDPRLAKVQEIFSVIQQPYEAPFHDTEKKTSYYMSVDTFTGAARYTNGIVINRDGRVTNYNKLTEGDKRIYIDNYQIIPLVRTLVQELTDLTKKPFSDTENVFNMIIRMTDLQKHLERIDLIDLSSVFIEINTYIDRDEASYEKAVKLIKEINSLVNLD